MNKPYAHFVVSFFTIREAVRDDRLPADALQFAVPSYDVTTRDVPNAHFWVHADTTIKAAWSIALEKLDDLHRLLGYAANTQYSIESVKLINFVERPQLER